MSEPSAAMQKGIYDALMADAPLAALMGGAVRVFDVVPPDAVFPYVTIGDDQLLDRGLVDCDPDLFEYFATIHVWSRPSNVGRIEAKNIAGRVREILKVPPAVTGFAVKCSTTETTDHLRDPDGITAHSVLTQRFLVTLN